MPDKQKERSKVRQGLDTFNTQGRGIAEDYDRRDKASPKETYGPSGEYLPLPKSKKTVTSKTGYYPRALDTQKEVDEAYALYAARKPRRAGSPREEAKRAKSMGPMAGASQREIKRAQRKGATKMAAGGKVRGDGICQRGGTKGRFK